MKKKYCAAVIMGGVVGSYRLVWQALLDAGDIKARCNYYSQW